MSRPNLKAIEVMIHAYKKNKTGPRTEPYGTSYCSKVDDAVNGDTECRSNCVLSCR